MATGEWRDVIPEIVEALRQVQHRHGNEVKWELQKCTPMECAACNWACAPGAAVSFAATSTIEHRAPTCAGTQQGTEQAAQRLFEYLRSEKANANTKTHS